MGQDGRKILAATLESGGGAVKQLGSYGGKMGIHAKGLLQHHHSGVRAGALRTYGISRHARPVSDCEFYPFPHQVWR